jgi:hypothetical protein
MADDIADAPDQHRVAGMGYQAIGYQRVEEFGWLAEIQGRGAIFEHWKAIVRKAPRELQHHVRVVSGGPQIEFFADLAQPILDRLEIDGLTWRHLEHAVLGPLDIEGISLVIDRGLRQPGLGKAGIAGFAVLSGKLSTATRLI